MPATRPSARMRASFADPKEVQKGPLALEHPRSGPSESSARVRMSSTGNGRKGPARSSCGVLPAGGSCGCSRSGRCGRKMRACERKRKAISRRRHPQKTDLGLRRSCRMALRERCAERAHRLAKRARQLRYPQGVDCPCIDESPLGQLANCATSTAFVSPALAASARGLLTLSACLFGTSLASFAFHASPAGCGRCWTRKCDYWSVSASVSAGSSAVCSSLWSSSLAARFLLICTPLIAALDPRPAIGAHAALISGFAVRRALIAPPLRPYVAAHLATLVAGISLWSQEPKNADLRGLSHAGWHLLAASSTQCLLPLASPRSI